MKSWFHSAQGQPEPLELREVPIPVPSTDELLVRVHAASLNRGEFLARKNLTPSSGAKAAGIECAGKIIQLGSGQGDFCVGEMVMGRAAMAFSEYALMRCGEALRVPPGLNSAEAASASIAYLVAYDMLWNEGALKPGEWLLITGVSSGVGVASLQLGKLRGAKVIGTTRSADKLEKLKELGLEHVLLDQGEGFSEQVLALTEGRGVDLVVNNVGGSCFIECMRLLAYQGRLATVGHLDGVGKAEIDLLAQHTKRLKLFGVSNKLRSSDEIASCVIGFRQDVIPSITAGQVKPVIDKVFTFEDLPQALGYMTSNLHIGKVVIQS